MELGKDFPNVARWLEALKTRPAVERGLAVGREMREQLNLASDKGAQSVLFGQRAR
jgi:GST-like protein